MNASDTAPDAVEHPSHYNSHPSGVEVYLITQEMWCPNLANAFKYMTRYEHKGNPAQDIRKAAKYVEFEKNRRMLADYHGGIYLPQSPLLKWEARFAPFYKYIAAEPDEYMAKKLIVLWNADKNDNEAANSWLNGLHQWLIALAAEIDKRALAALETLSVEQSREVSKQVHEFRYDMDSGIMSYWNEWEIEYRGDWRKITNWELHKGGKVELTIEGLDSTFIFNPRDSIKLRTQENT